MSKKRKREDATFEQKISITLHDLISFSVFVQSYTTLQTIALKAVNLENLVLGLIFLLKNNMARKNLLNFGMLTQRGFLLFKAVV